MTQAYRLGQRGRPENDSYETGREAVELYARTYRTILRSTGDVKVRAFISAHQQVQSALHAGAARPTPDLGAFIYAVQRLPTCIVQVERIVCGQLPEQFERELHANLDDWQMVQAPGRRRRWRYDGVDCLAVHLASPSDLDDVIPTLVAYQIEWNKLHHLLQPDAEADGPGWTPATPDATLVERLQVAPDDWRRLRAIWGPAFDATLQAIAAAPKDLSVRLLGGPHVGYAKQIRRWWQPLGEALARHGLEQRPVYFVSSNMHSLANLVSGYVLRRADALSVFLDQMPEGPLSEDLRELRAARDQTNWENLLYYASRLWHRSRPNDRAAKDERRQEEAERGIWTVPSGAGLDVDAQIIDLSRLRREDLDPRLADLADALSRSNAVVVNIDYPLGLAAYFLLRQVTEAIDDLRGVYILGKAATLNGAIGDVMMTDVVYDEHSGNVYSYNNAFSYEDVAPYLERGSVLDNQKAVTVKGTFLQNRDYLEFFYREYYTVVEMEAGPYLSALYEAAYSGRYPMGEDVHLRHLPVDVGLIYYASDTPYTRARTLGNRGLSFEGIDSTYAGAVAIARRILACEAWRTEGRPSPPGP